LGHDTGDGIGRSTGGKSDHDMHRPVRIALRRRRRDCGEQPHHREYCGCEYAQNDGHCASPPTVFVGAIIGERGAPDKGKERCPARVISEATA
jgi:hypothetical protein